MALQKQMRDVLIQAYLDYTNNYLSIEKYAEHNGLSLEQGQDFIRLARKVALSDHPEA